MRSRTTGVLALAAAVAVLAPATPARAGTTYIFVTGDENALPADQRLVIAAVYGNAGINIIGTTASSNGDTINGTVVRPGGTNSNGITNFNIAGNLNLGDGDVIAAWGSNPIQLNVAADANLAATARISADAIGPFSGAGGGTGGSAGQRFSGPRATVPGPGGFNFDASLPVSPQHNGVNGGNGGPTTLGNTPALHSYAGTPGTAGVNSIGAPASGATGQIASVTLPQGGEGGQGGVYQNPDGTDGIRGEHGGPGANGVFGKSGPGGTSVAIVANSAILHGGGGGGGGSNGGDGVAGGGGGQGGSGGGGVGVPIIIVPGVTPPSDSPFGGPGSAGSAGARGGMGQNGGGGGGGAGAIGIAVGGKLTVAGKITANGGAGTNAAYDGPETGVGVIPVGVPTPGGATGFAVGGKGGASGQGGSGGGGGYGGGGGGGAGGSVYVSASSYDQNNASALVANGGVGGNSGDEYTDEPFPGFPVYHAPRFLGINGAAGDIRVNTLGGATVNRNNSLTAPGTINPYRSYDAFSTTLNNYNGATTPNLSSGIEGGVAAFGRATNPDGSFVNNGASVIRLIYGNAVPTNARAVVTQASAADSDFSASYNTLAYTVLESHVELPGFKLFRNVNPHIPDYIPNPANGPVIDPVPEAAALVSSGWQRDARFVAGATGDAAIDALSPGQTYYTMVEKPVAGTYNLVVGQFAPYAKPRTFSLLYDANQPMPPLFLTDTGLPRISVLLPNNNTFRVFDQDGDTRDVSEQLHASMRAGTTRVATASVVNLGNDISRMAGNISIGSANKLFSGLGANNGAETGISITASALPGTLQTIPFGVSTDAGGIVGPMTIHVVGPTLELRTEEPFAATLQLGETDRVIFHLANNGAAPEGVSPQQIEELSDLDLLGVSIVGDAAGAFSLIHNNLFATTIGVGEGTLNGVSFDGAATPGVYTATLRLVTDQNAEYMTAGQVFDLPMSVTVVPEPTALGVIAFGGTLALLRRRRRT